VRTPIKTRSHVQGDVWARRGTGAAPRETDQAATQDWAPGLALKAATSGGERPVANTSNGVVRSVVAMVRG
jgi:hypothetical protein